MAERGSSAADLGWLLAVDVFEPETLSGSLFLLWVQEYCIWLWLCSIDKITHTNLLLQPLQRHFTRNGHFFPCGGNPSAFPQTIRTGCLPWIGQVLVSSTSTPRRSQWPIYNMTAWYISFRRAYIPHTLPLLSLLGNIYG